MVARHNKSEIVMPTAARADLRLMSGLCALVLGCCALVAGPAGAQTIEYRTPDQVPPTWIQFSKLVKYRFEQWIGSDDPIAARFRVYIKVHTGRPDGPPALMTVRAWINPNGTVAQVSFPEFKDAGATKDLRTILVRGNVGESPPPDMLQPLNLRFSLRFKQ